jgi:hypothetical protein
MTKRFWICKFLLALAFVLGGPMLHAQLSLTSAAGTLVDQDGTTWFNAQVTATFVPNPSYPNLNQYYVTDPVNGTVPLTGPIYNQYITQHTTSSSVGTFAIALIDNSKIAPTGSSWKLTIQSYTSAPSSVFPNVTVSGISQVLNSFLSANITAPRFSAVSGFYGGAFGYNNAEISVIPVPGGSYYDVTLQTVKVWNGTAWTQQAIGSYCPLTGSCNYTGAVTTKQLNNVCEASQETGADFGAQINACANESYMTLGGIITAYGYGNTSQTSTTPITATSIKTRPIEVLLNPATQFFFNQNMGATAINQAIASEVSGHASGISYGAGYSACIWPVNNGSSIDGGSQLTYLRMVNTARTYDFFCNAAQDGTQESMVIKNLGIANSTGTGSNTVPGTPIPGSLLHARNLYVGTVFQNVNTYLPYGNAVTTDGGSDILFDNDAFQDSDHSGGYVGTVVEMHCPNRFTFHGGAIQFNGINNTLLKITNCNISGHQYNPVGVHFQNTDFEIQPATVGAFAGHDTNIDPIQETDGGDIVWDALTLYGGKGAGQNHIVDILSTGNDGHYRGPVEINNMYFSLSDWTNIAAISNTDETAPAGLQNVYGIQNDSSLGVGHYKWEGGTTALSHVVDYYDNMNIQNLQSITSQIFPTVFSVISGTCNSALEGTSRSVTDSATNISGRAIVGGGTFHVSAYCNGTGWYVASGAGNTNISEAFTVCASGCTYTTTICTTTGNTYSSGGCAVGTYSWPIPFPDSNYSVTCGTPGAATQVGGSGADVGAVITYGSYPLPKSLSSVSIGLQATTAVTITVPEIDCIGVHN